ncbi:hypothetical protein U1Q18_019264 [Sarracenia purpurea var. burkii]
MDKLLEFGRKAMFYVRVLSGYEERRIRSYRLQLQKRIQQSEEKKAALKKIPEQIILSEVRRMVEEMQALNRKLEETEASIEEYFKPIDKEAEIIMKMQLEGEEKTMRQMVKTMQTQALLEKAEADRIANVKNAEASQHVQENVSTSSTQAEVR